MYNREIDQAQISGAVVKLLNTLKRVHLSRSGGQSNAVSVSQLSLWSGIPLRGKSGQPILDALLRNLRVRYDPEADSVHFRAKYESIIWDFKTLMAHIKSLGPTGLYIEQDLLETYPGIDADITQFLANQKNAQRAQSSTPGMSVLRIQQGIRAIRNGDNALRLKCLRYQKNMRASRCNLYSTDRCERCKSNYGVVLFAHHTDDSEKATNDCTVLKQAWRNLLLPSPTLIPGYQDVLEQNKANPSIKASSDNRSAFRR